MKTLRNLLGLTALAAVCLVPTACSTDGPTSSPSGARRSIVTDTTKAPSSTNADSAVAPPCRDGGGVIGSGSRC